ncbi:MAG: helix-turn-helix transcriptional regulator [Prevotella sp.]|nr:helix-turn-helix transcriptional regulator [Prevotella sp.]
MSENFTIPRLKELRLENSLMQRHLAEYLHCTQQTYSRYENGGLQISLPHLISLTYFYDVSTDYILGLTDVRKRPSPPGG